LECQSWGSGEQRTGLEHLSGRVRLASEIVVVLEEFQVVVVELALVRDGGETVGASRVVFVWLNDETAKVVLRMSCD